MRLLSPLALAALLAGCSSPDGEHVSREMIGDDWPLTVEDGYVDCEAGQFTQKSHAVFRSDGVTYAVNGTAKSRTDYPDIEQIWAPNPEIPGLGMDITPILSRAVALCD